jgi:transposase
MKYIKVKELPSPVFRRITGVKRDTFERMVEIIREAEAKRVEGVGRPKALSLEDQTLMTLEYLREYRTYAHIAVDYGVSESTAFRVIRRVEDALVASKQFALPKRTRPLSGDPIEAIVVDCTESPIERPQKNSGDTTRERRSGIRSRARS